MEELKHRNDIEIKLLPNRRFIYSNRRQNIVITAENKATDITVLFPDEYEGYSKRVDFVNSQGKEWTEGLYIPEYKPYPAGFNKCRFHFTLPTEVTTAGELKMQFIAYKPDESMAYVPFEVVTIDVQDGVLAFKKNARSNPDLLILSYNRSTQALFNSEQAKAKSIEAVGKATEALANSENAVEVSAAAKTESETAVSNSETALAGVTALESDLTTERAAREQGDEENAQAIADETSARVAALEAEAVIRLEADNTENEARAQADAELQANITAETERASQAESDLAALVAAETARATEAEQVVNQELAAETERAVDAESGLSGAIAAEVERATNAENDNTQAITEEQTARQAADITEQAARIQGDSINASAIQAEASRAQEAEQNLANAIQSETTRAQTTEQTNAAAIANEKVRAQAAEGNLQTAVNTESTRAATAENTLSAAVATEANRATVAEAGLAAALNSEQVRAQTQESLLQGAVNTESTRAQTAEALLGARLDTAVQNAVEEANGYTDQAIEQVRIDGTFYKGTVLESGLPAENQTNGDLYWISDFDITRPEHSGSAIWNGGIEAWDFSIDKYKHEDGDTIVPRESDGALKVADTVETNLNADTTDYGETVSAGFKATIRNIIRKIKGLFVKATANETAITTETERAQTAESGIAAGLATETTRAQTAEGLNAAAIQAETARAQSAEQTNATAIANEAARATTAESGKVDKVAGKGLSSEDYTAEEKSKLSGIEPCAEVNAVAGISVNGGEPVYPNGGKIIPLEVATGIAELPDTVPKNRGQWSSSTVYAKGDLVYKTWNSPAAKVWYLSLADGNVNHTPLLPNWTTDVMYWECLNAVSGTVRTYINPSLSFPRGILLGGHKDNQEDFNSVYWDKKVYSQDGKVYDTRGELAAMSDVPTALPASGGDADTVEGFHASDFATAEQGAAGEQALAELDGKVDKIAGKGLSTEDYTAEEKQKLTGIAAGAEVNEVTEAPLDGKQYARKDGEWDEVSGAELLEGIWTNKGAWSSAATYRKGDVVSVATEGVLRTLFVSLIDGNLDHNPALEYAQSAPTYWRNLSQVAHTSSKVATEFPSDLVNNYLLTTALTTVAVNTPVARNGNVYADTAGNLYDIRGKLSAVIKYGEEETDTGNEWIDGKPIYRRVFTGNAATANNISITLMTGAAFIVACGGGWQPGYSSGDYVSLTAPGNNQISCAGGLYLKGNGSVVFYSSSAASRENGYNVYGIWAEYTKK